MGARKAPQPGIRRHATALKRLHAFALRVEAQVPYQPHDLRFSEEFLDIHVLAARLGVRVGHVRALVAKHQLPVVRVGRLLRFDWTAVRQWLARTTAQHEAVEEVA